MPSFDYYKLSVNELTVDTLNLLRDGNMIIKSNTAIRMNSSATSLLLDNHNIRLNSENIIINDDINLIDFINNFNDTTFIKQITVNGELQTNNNGTVNITVPTDYLTLDDTGDLAINGKLILGDNPKTIISSEQLDTTSISANRITADEVIINSTTINVNGIHSNDIQAHTISVIDESGISHSVATQDNIPIVDEEVTEQSTNPVQSVGIYNKINESIKSLQAEFNIQLDLLKQHFSITNLLFDSTANKLYIYIDKNITYDYTVINNGVIVDITSDISNINEDTVIKEDYMDKMINCEINNKELAVKTKDLEPTMAMDDYVYIRGYADINKNNQTYTIYSPLYIITKQQLENHSDCYPFVWE